MKTIRNVCKLFHFGDKPVQSIFDGPVEITEKIDGSQFAFGKIEGELIMRSKGALIFPGAVPDLFKPVVNWVMANEPNLPNNVVLYGETLCKPRHNTLQYGRVPKGNFILFGIERHADADGLSFPLPSKDRQFWAEHLGCEAVPVLFNGTVPTLTMEGIRGWLHDQFMDRTSILGEAKIEGIVIKNYAKQTVFLDHMFDMMCAQLVSAEFKEKHVAGWKESNPSALEQIGQSYNAEARWRKAVQYLRDTDQLTGTVKDIGPLIKYLSTDLHDEEKENIKDLLFSLFWKDIQRIAVKGFAPWYKEQLLKGEF